MKWLLSLVFLFLLTIPANAYLDKFTPQDAFLDVVNQNTNNHTSASYALKLNDAYAMQYNFSTLAGRHINYARMYIWSSRAANNTFAFYRFLTNFNVNQVTWNVSSTGNNWNTAGGTGLGVDYTTTNSVTGSLASGAYVEYDITGIVSDCLTAGNTCSVAFRSSSGNATAFDTIDTAQNSTNPPYMVVNSNTPGTPNVWWTRDGGGSYGLDSTHCNGTTNALFTGSNGPNCAVNSPQPFLSTNGLNPPIMVGGETLNTAEDSDTTFGFNVTSVVNRPGVGDTYTTGGITYTVTVTLPTGQASGLIQMLGSSSPSAPGTLTNVTCAGTCDASISYGSISLAQAQYGVTTGLTVPAGTATDPTVIQGFGSGVHYAQIYAASNINTLVNASLSYMILKNLDLTDHDNCIHGGPIGPGVQTVNSDGYLYVCGGGSVSVNNTVLWGGTGLYFINDLVHGGFNGMNNNINGNAPGGTIGNIILWNTKIFGNPGQGAIMGNSQAIDNVMTGTMYLLYSQVDFNGCGQRYPLQDTSDIFKDIPTQGFSTAVDNESNYYNCWGQDQGGYGDGYGFGPTGAAPAGNWIMIGSSTSFNTQDGTDTLHGKSNGIFIILRCRFEGNGGEQLKPNGFITFVENSIINGDCARWVGASESSTTTGTGKSGCAVGFYISSVCNQNSGVCRADGDSMSFTLTQGSQVYLYNNTVNTNGIAFLFGGSSCDSTTGIHFYNNIVNGGAYAVYDPAISYQSNARLSSYYFLSGSDGNGKGACGPPSNGTGGVMVADEDYNIVYNTKNNNSGCSGAHDKCGNSPGFISTYNTGAVTVSNGSTSVSGTSTNWTSSMVGEVIGFSTTSQAAVTTWYVVSTVNSPTSLTLGSAYSGSNLSGATYVISLAMGTPSGPASYYYHGTNMYSYVNLSSSSVAVGLALAGKATVPYDFNNYAYNSPPDDGAVQLNTWSVYQFDLSVRNVKAKNIIFK